MTWLYRFLALILLCAIIYFIYANIRLNQRLVTSEKALIKIEQESIINRQKLIDSISASKLLITKELLNSEKNIKKLQLELLKTNNDNLTLDDAKKILGL